MKKSRIYIALSVIILATILVTFLFKTDEEKQIKIVEREIYDQDGFYDLNKDRARTEVKKALNPSRKGACIQKETNTPVSVIEEDGTHTVAKTKLCDPFVSDFVVKTGTTVMAGNMLYHINHIFMEEVTEPNIKMGLKSGDHICIAVDRLAQLPEYETKGPWLLFKCLPAH